MIENNKNNAEIILNEILIAPSNDILMDRFSATKETTEAICSGHCRSGSCMAIS